MLNIKQKHIKEFKKCGELDGVIIHHLLTYGGLNILALMKAGEPEIIAMGPHKMVAQEIASKKHPKIKWND